MIPNQEIRGLFIDQIRIWFKETSRANKETISTFCSAFPERNAACDKALTQIEDQQYAASLEEDGMKTIIKYGIACYKKECKVKLG